MDFFKIVFYEQKCTKCIKTEAEIVRIGQNAFLKKVLKILLTFVELGCILTKVAEHGNNKSTKTLMSFKSLR